MRIVIVLALVVLNSGTAFAREPASPPNACQVCGDQKTACMKNYAGPTCKSEYKMCMKSCGKK